ncbi:lymphocyte antigen 6H isoform X2 [Etheostoma cragini]|uniref:lymphocyte antigen 6H isoform X2 n=1 Tax=Etheostoma cragini TaxID=417921 RepID=UPI00155E89B9|nr:lymphocyte antigen 6H isoform X2 [Etheostoma cragini]
MRSNTFLCLTPPPSSSTSPPLDTPLIHSFSGLRGRRRDQRPAAMKNALALLLLISLACHSHTLKCHTCVASNDDDCNRQGSTPCPQYADACSTITGPSTVMKSCTYKAFCDKAHGVSSGAKMDCCFGDDCNGPHRSHHRNGAGAVGSSPVLLVTALLLRVATSQL